MEEQLCAVCSVPCTLRCGKCKNVSYCSKEHQTNHWGEHKKDCRHPFKIGTHPEKGRILIATKDMDPYSVIFQEESIFNLPTSKGDDELVGSICVSCCKVEVSKKLRNCSKCSSPVCGRDCELAKIHADFECKVLSKEISLSDASLTATSVIRCMLLKTQDREKYDALMTLQSNKEHFYKDENVVEEITSTSSTVDLLLKEVGLLDFNQEEIATVFGIINTNSLTNTAMDNIRRMNIGSAENISSSMHLYSKTCLASHSCVPNAKPIIQNSGRVKLVAIRPIVVGDEITIAYTNLYQGTVQRQKILQSCYYFLCKCTRCEDPTELGTNFSSVKCRQCADGYLLPKCQWDSKPDLKTDALWICNGSGCSQENTDAQIQELFDSLNNEIYEIHAKGSTGMETVTEMEALIAKYSGNILHPNHHMLITMDDAFTWSTNIIIDFGDFSSQEIQYLHETLVAKCKKLLTFCDKLFSETRGEKLYLLWKGMQDDPFRQKLAAFNSLSQEQSDAIIDSINDLLDVAKEAVQILSLETDVVIYQDWVKELKEWIQQFY